MWLCSGIEISENLVIVYSFPDMHILKSEMEQQQGCYIFRRVYTTVQDGSKINESCRVGVFSNEFSMVIFLFRFSTVLQNELMEITHQGDLRDIE